MNATLLKSLLALVPAVALFAASLLVFVRARSTGSFLQLLGAGFLVIVVLTHTFEALDFFPWMHWGRPHSVGHYLDLGSAILGLTLVPSGYILRRKGSRRLTSD